MTGKQATTLSCDTSRTVIFHMRGDVFVLQISKKISNYLGDRCFKIRQRCIYYYECDRAYYFFSHYYVLANPAKMFTLRKKMYLEVKRTSGK